MKPVAITGKLITRNWAFNLLGQGLPLVVGLFTIPWLLRYLGVERFGVLSITWAVLGYVGQFDLGLGRATTRYVADSLGRGANAELPATQAGRDDEARATIRRPSRIETTFIYGFLCIDWRLAEECFVISQFRT